MEAEQNPGGEVLATTPGFKPKNAGSLIPKEKKLVKKMMWEQMVASVAVLLPTSSAGHNPKNRATGEAKPPKPTAHKKGKTTSPLHPPMKYT